ncbi:hypothetical protein AMAG_00582 [Allomyces macrogynus ATCC 38327]|uniref:Ubiquitin-like domain-containing protein n=1 Tax=Allomyces macrogynus (strain ATCC 38327) TaxID=578462 RepID=A0A0L0RWB7_ALLM3|nr:hypothetical protein AMAG_00582 [Allomyces macrogynus ATCC 38327]|eukprot:KNE54618.1 hypothetical protein AMAG_00582 [Allomyces macrogynus ATCC 38327]
MTLSTLTLRVKRHKTTYFVQCSATDTVLALKRRVAKLVGRDPRDVRLLVPKDKMTTTVDYAAVHSKDKLAELEDKAVLDQLGMPDDAVVFAVFWVPGEINAAEGKWEPVDLPEPAPLIEADEELSEAEHADAGASRGADKGKARA